MAEPKKSYLKKVQKQIEARDFTVVDKDMERPWGGFFVIDEEQARQFAGTHFKEQPQSNFSTDQKLSPKILVVQPNKRLSWQYHHRRAEIWKVVEGPVGVVTSDTDKEGPLQKHQTGDTIKVKQGERHRLVGLENWAVVAEIWQHTDADNPSTEEDIVRLQDDYGR